MSDSVEAYRAEWKGREEGARDEAMAWREATRPEVIAEAIHTMLVEDGLGCTHTALGKRCELYARAIHRRIMA